MLRIAKENMNMLRRIHQKKPAISVEKFEKDWRQNLKFMDNISSFPEDWYLRENQNHSRSNPNISTNRSTSEKNSPRKPLKISKTNKKDTTTTETEGETTETKETTDYENEFDNE